MTAWPKAWGKGICNNAEEEKEKNRDNTPGVYSEIMGFHGGHVGGLKQ